MENAIRVWTGDDYEHHKCRADQIGTPKEQDTSIEEPSAVIEALPPTTMAELKQAALRVARGKMGFDEFLQKNPTFHQKFLLSMAKEAPPPQRQDLTVNISWLTAERLAYKDQPTLELVQETQSTKSDEHSAKSSEPALGWKPGPPSSGLAHILREEDKS